MIHPLPKGDLGQIQIQCHQLRREGGTILPQGDAFGKALRHFGGKEAVQPGQVHLGDVAFGGQNAVGQLPVIGDDDKAGGVLVQPPGGEQTLPPQLWRHQIHHGGAVLIPGGGHHPGGLIHHQVEMAAQN